MSRAFNAEEILEVAVQIEQMGAAYYRQAATLAKDPATVSVLNELAEMEEGHEILFENLRADPDVLMKLIGDPQGETALYLQAFADGQVFPTHSSAIDSFSPNADLDSVLSEAITLELKTIAFYQGIKDAFSSEIGNKKINEIIAEEKKHVTLLSQKLAAERTRKAGSK